MRRRMIISLAAMLVVIGFSAQAQAQTQTPAPEQAPAPAQEQGVVTERQISLSLAQEAAQAAVEQCRADGFQVSAAVVDRAGNLKALLRDDNTGPHTVESSRRKAFTASAFRASTADLVNRVAGDPSLANLDQLAEGLLFLGGGLPIQAGQEVVGGIGVGGAPSGQADEVCAQAGINTIADRLQ